MTWIVSTRGAHTDNQGNAFVSLHFDNGQGGTYDVDCHIPLDAPATFVSDFVARTIGSLTAQYVAIGVAEAQGGTIIPTPALAPVSHCDLSILGSELNVDPAGVGYKANGIFKSNSELLSLLNTSSQSVLGHLPMTTFLVWCAQNNAIKTMQAHIGDSGSIGSVCSTAMVMFTAASIEFLDLTDVNLVGMLNAMVSASLFSQGQIDALLSLGTTQKSRAQVIECAAVQLSDISAVTGV